VFVTALALASLGSVAAASTAEHIPSVVRQAVPAALTLLLTVPLVLIIYRRRADDLALAHPIRSLFGTMVVLTCASLVLVPAIAAGWIKITDVDLPALLGFLAVNTVMALALEAVPEELVFRGSIFGTVRSYGPGWLATIVATAAFVVAPGASIGLTAVLGSWLDLPVPPATFAPGGQNPVDYAVLLVVFSVCLVLARVATRSIWTSVGAHLSFLTVNRIVYPGRADTGVTTTVDSGTELLVIAYLVLAIIVFATMLLPHRPDSSAPRRQTGPSAAPGRGEAPAVLERERR
jgi:membrane protease YdiL (CAAX protease family)